MPRTLEIVDGHEGWPFAEVLDHEVYPPEVMAKVPWRDVTWAHADKRVMVRERGVLVCHVGIYLRDGTHHGARVRIAGIGGVMTSERTRRQGCAGAALGLAASFMREHEIDFGLLFCEPHNIAFYEHLGWRTFAGEVFCEQPQGRYRFDMMPTMLLYLRTAPHAGVIDLCGLPW